jgi:hypothetical protein
MPAANANDLPSTERIPCRNGSVPSRHTMTATIVAPPSQRATDLTERLTDPRVTTPRPA